VEISHAAFAGQHGGGGGAGYRRPVLLALNRPLDERCFMKIIDKTYHGVKGLLSGMWMTIRYMVRFDQVITQQYPENRDRLVLPNRYKGQVELVKDPATGLYKCHGCGVCVKACPNNSIFVERDRDPVTKKPRLQKYVYHFERCTLCGLCVDSCKFEALQMGQRFETAVYDPQELTLLLNDQVPPVNLPQGSPGASTAPAPAPAASTPAASTPAEPNPPEQGKTPGQ
jgi:NADH-quinone oxidoreductase subunit I